MAEVSTVLLLLSESLEGHLHQGIPIPIGDLPAVIKAITNCAIVSAKNEAYIDVLRMRLEMMEARERKPVLQLHQGGKS